MLYHSSFSIWPTKVGKQEVISWLLNTLHTSAVNYSAYTR